MYREAKASTTATRCAAWARHRREPASARRRYKSARGKGGLVRATWDEAIEIVAAAHVHTIKKYGPDRVAGFSPIPAMSMVSHARRRPVRQPDRRLDAVASTTGTPTCRSPRPQVFGDQTDVPESGDWWNAGYLIMWGSNLPVTRTPDAHWMTEARYRGQKVVAVAPDYADNVKFADEWLPAQPGTDGALAMAMGHVVLKEFFVDRQTPYFTDYVQAATPTCRSWSALDERATATLRRRASSSPPRTSPAHAAEENAAFKTVLLDARDRRAGGAERLAGPPLRRRRAWAGGTSSSATSTRCCRCSTAPATSRSRSRCRASTTPDGAAADAARAACPARRVGGHLVTTVFDLLLAQYGVGRAGPARAVAHRATTTPTQPYTPAWQEAITGVPAAAAARIGREFAANAEESRGRSMIIMGAGTNHWFHSDTIYRAFLALTTLTGCQGVNGGGWAHYVGQEKVRPLTGYTQIANALDWTPAAAQHDPDRLLVPAHRPVPLRPVRRRHAVGHRWAAGSSPARPPPT